MNFKECSSSAKEPLTEMLLAKKTLQSPSSCHKTQLTILSKA